MKNVSILNRKNTRRDAGFTLAELLLVVVLVLILAGVGVVAAMTMLRNARQASADKAAEAIFADVQNYMQEVIAFEKGNSRVFEPNTESGAYELIKDGSAEDVGTHLVYAQKAMGDESGTAIAGITNEGSVIGSEFYNKGLVIEYDRTSGQVHAVFYADTDEFSYDDVRNDSGFRSSVDTRMQRYGGHVGYYESNTQSLPSDTSMGMVVKIDNTAMNKSNELYNYDELKARLYCKLPDGVTGSSSDKRIRVIVKTTGVTSGAVRIDKVEDSPNTFSIENSIFHMDIVFDSLQNDSSRKRFKELFGEGSSVSLFGVRNGTSIENPESGKAFIPGENIDVKATVEVLDASGGDGNAPAIAMANDEARDNSLYSYVKGSSDVVASDYKAYIKYGRHLQNLDSDSGIVDVAQIATIDAIQVKDVFFNKNGEIEEEKDDSTNTSYIADNTINRLWADKKVYGDGNVKEIADHYNKFRPVRNTKLKSYDGKGEEPGDSEGDSTNESSNPAQNQEKEPYAIKGLYINADGNAGLFESFSGESLKNIRLENARIKGSGENVGGLAGEITSAATIENCRLYMKSSDMDQEDQGAQTSNSNTSSGAQGDEQKEYNKEWLDNWRGEAAGAGDKTAYDANDWLSGSTNVGGLVGKADGALTIKNSFAATVVNATGDASKAGGIIGDAAGTVNVESSFADCYIAGKNIGGLAGACAEGSTFTNCYSAGFVMSQNKAAGIADDVKAGAFVPDAGFAQAEEGQSGSGSGITNSYSLFNFNDIAQATYEESSRSIQYPDSINSKVTTRESNGLKAPRKEGEIGAGGNSDTDVLGRGYYLSKVFDKNASDHRSLKEYRFWDRTANNGGGAYTIDYTRESVPHFNDWLPDEGQDIDLEIINTEELAFRINLANEPSSSEIWKVYLKGMTSQAERILEISKGDDQIAEAAGELAEVKASDFNTLASADKKTVSFRNDSTGAGEQEEKKYTSAWIVLDELKDTDTADGWTFKSQFCSAINSESASEAEKKAFVPGEDILISWGEKLPYDQGSDINAGELSGKLTDKDAIVNSLFSGKLSYKKSEAADGQVTYEEKKVPEDGISAVLEGRYQAKIAYGRHLQNLDTTLSGFDGATAATIEAQQLNDIYFDAQDYEGYKPNSDRAHVVDTNDIWEQQNRSRDTVPAISDQDKLRIADDCRLQWSKVYDKRTFIPITNEKLEKYDGEHNNKGYDGKDTDRTRIVALRVSIANNSTGGNAGLFGTFSGKDLKDITLVSPMIAGSGSGNTGGIAGELTGSSVKISGCRLYMRPKYEEPLKDADGTHSKGDPLDVKDGDDARKKMDKWLVGGSNAGGLAGLAQNDLEIEDSFAATVVNAKGGDAGGLVGHAAKLDVGMSYADCYIHGNNIGGLAGACSDSSRFNDCYSAGFVLGSESGNVGSGTNAGSFVPDEDISVEKDNIDDSYSLFYFADITVAKYSDGEADFDGESNYTPGTVFNNGLVTPDRDEIDRLNERVNGIGKEGDPNIHVPYYLAKFFQSAREDGRDRLAKFAYWDSEKNDGEGGFRNKYPYPKAGLPHYGDWLTTEISLKVYNDVMLYARLRVPSGADKGDITMTVTVDDDKNKNSDSENDDDDEGNNHYKATIKVRNTQKVDPDGIKNIYRVKEKKNEYVSYYVVLDDITTKNLRFTDIFTNTKVVEKAYQKHFYPGVTITKITAVAGSEEVKAKDATPLFPGEEDFEDHSDSIDDDDEDEDDDDDDDDDDEKNPYWNSIYANESLYDDEDNNTNKAIIKNFRHLENLDRRISGRLETGDKIGDDNADDDNIIEIEEASQQADLIWMEDAKTGGNLHISRDDDKSFAFVERVKALKKKWKADDNENDVSHNGVAIYSTRNISGSSKEVRPFNDEDADSYMPVNIWLGVKDKDNGQAANKTFTYDAKRNNSGRSSTYDQVYDEDRFTISNLYVKAPEHLFDIEGATGAFVGIGETASGGRNEFSEIEKNPDIYYVDAGLFGFVEVKENADFTVKNLKLIETDIEDCANSGGLIGRINLVTNTGGNGPGRTSGTIKLEKIDIVGDTYVNGNMIMNGGAVYARGYAGGFFGVASEADIIMDKCRIYGEKAFVYNQSNDDAMEGAGRQTTIGGSSAGGVSGSLQWCSFDISDCSTSVYVYGEEVDTAGGFFGRTYGNYKRNGGSSRITNCYVGAHTKNGAFLQGVFRKGSSQQASNVVGYNSVGGFIAYTQSVSNSAIEISKCFSVASVYSNWKGKHNKKPHAGGFLAHIVNASNATTSVKDCYETGRLYVDSGYYFDNTGLFVGEVQETNRTTLENNRVLDGINHVVRRLVGSPTTFNTNNDKVMLAALEGPNGLGTSSSVPTDIFDKTLKKPYPFDPKGITHYYGDWELPGDADFDMKWSIINKDKLSLEMIIPNEILDGSDENKAQMCFITMKVKGVTSKKYYYAPIWIYRYWDGINQEMQTKVVFEDPKDLFEEEGTYTLPDGVFAMGTDFEKIVRIRSDEESNNTIVCFDFDDITNTYGHFAQLFQKLYPGEDIEVALTLGEVRPDDGIWNSIWTSGTSNEDTNDNETDTKNDIKMTSMKKTGAGVSMLRTNSLFGFNSTASANEGDVDNKAEIRWGRHLQNLDPVVSGVNKVGDASTMRKGLVFVSAEQTKDIDWDKFYEGYYEGDKPSIYSFYQSSGTLKNKELAKNGEYYGVFNIKLRSYKGKVDDSENKAAKISNITTNRNSELSISNFVDPDDYSPDDELNKGYKDKGNRAGLFRHTVYGLDVSNLELSNFTVNGSSDSGSIIGGSSDKVNNLTVKLEDIVINDTLNVTSEKSSAGGLVGTVGKNATLTIDKITINSSPVIAGYSHSGGLVGLINDCAASKTTEIKNISIKSPSVTSNNDMAGGLIGKTGNTIELKIEDITVDGSTVITGSKDAGGLVGGVNGGNGLDVVMKKISVSKPEVTSRNGSAGGLLGSIGENAKLTIEDINLGESLKVNGLSHSGGLAGLINNGNNLEVNIRQIKIKNPEVSGSKGSVGGLVGKIGKNRNVTVDDVSVSGKISVSSDNKNHAGGFAGCIDDGSTVNIGAEKGFIISSDEGSLVKAQGLNSVDDETCAGGLIGRIGFNNPCNTGLTISNTKIENLSTFGNRAGGLIADVYNGYKNLSISDAHVYGENTYAYGGKEAGGFIAYLGYSNVGQVTIDSSSASIYVASEGGNAGGFIGRLRPYSNGTQTQGTISKCYVGGHTVVDSDENKAVYKDEQALSKDGDVITVNKGGYNVYGEFTKQYNVGGFIGRFENNAKSLTVDHCFTTASVSGTSTNSSSKIAGFCGGDDNNESCKEISDCYSAGAVYGKVGYNAKYDVFCKNTVGSNNYYLQGSDRDGTPAPGLSQAQVKTVDELKNLDPSSRAEKTVRFDGAEGDEGSLDYHYPFYTDAESEPGTTFFGDWEEGNVHPLRINLTKNGRTYTFYYNNGKFSSTEEENRQ